MSFFSYKLSELDGLLEQAAHEDDFLAAAFKLERSGQVTKEEALKIAAVELSRERARLTEIVLGKALLAPPPSMVIKVTCPKCSAPGTEVRDIGPSVDIFEELEKECNRATKEKK